MDTEKANKLFELSSYLRPPGQGIYTVSTGKSKTTQFTQAYCPKFSNVLNHLKNIDWSSPKVFLLGIPSDTGAGFLKGAAHGPQAIRQNLIDQDFDLDSFIDLGDIVCIPHLLHDSMLSKEQLRSSRKALYQNPEVKYPVSPLSITARVLEILLDLNPQLKILSLGGDHSCSLPLLQTYLQKNEKRTAILHIDAHTDLMEERLGVKYCYATWAFHILKDLVKSSDLIQIGIRASSHDKKYWQEKYGIQQYRMNELKNPQDFFNEFNSYLKKNHIEQIYISNDIDGTDIEYAGLCGTPERAGIQPSWLMELFDLIHESDIKIIAGDIMEFAPNMQSKFAHNSNQTISLYCQKQLDLLRNKDA